MTHTEEVTAAVSNPEPALESPPVTDQSGPPLSGHVETSAPITSPLPPLHTSAASPAAHWVSATGGSLPRPVGVPQPKNRDEQAAEIVASLFQKWGIKRKSEVSMAQWSQSLKGQNELLSFLKKDGRVFAVLFAIFFGCFAWLFLIYKLKSPAQTAAPPANAGAPGGYAPMPPAGVHPGMMHGAGVPSTAYAHHYLPPGSVHAAQSGMTTPAGYPVQQPQAIQAGYVQPPMTMHAGYAQQPMAMQPGYMTPNPYQYAQTYGSYAGGMAPQQSFDPYYANYQFPQSQSAPLTMPVAQPYAPMAISPNAAAHAAGTRQKVCVER